MKRVAVTSALILMLVLAIGASHAATPWKLSGIYVESCSCDIPCPCVKGEMPTKGSCKGFLNWHIVHGFYGDVALDGVKATIMVDIPGATGEGNWTIATYVDEKASPEQVEAIGKITQELLGFLITKDLGVKSVPIDFEMSGDTYRWSIPEIYELESVLIRDMPSYPGFFAPTYLQAEAVVQKYKDYDRDWDFSGQNSWQGRLLLPPEAPSDKIVGTIRAGAGAEGVAVNPYTRTAVVANQIDGTVSLIDLTTQKVTKTISVGNRTIGPAVNPYTNIAVVANRGDNTASIIDLSSGVVKKHIPVGKNPVCIGMDAVRNIAVVPNMDSNDVSVIDLKEEKVVKTIPVGAIPVCMHWDVNPYTNQAITALLGENALSVIDLEEGVEIQKIPVGIAPIGASLNPYTNMAVVPNSGSNDVSIVDLTAGKVINTIPVGISPFCSVIEPTMNLALVSNFGEDTVSLIDLNAMSVVDTITVGVLPVCFAIDAATMTALVTNSGSNDVTIIDLKKIPPAEDFSRVFFLKLESGLNMISLPLKPLTQRTARELMNEIGATVVIKLDAQRSRFVGFTEADPGDGFKIEGGRGYIVNVKESKVVSFVGAAWTNQPPLAPHFSVGAALKADSAWAFVVSGMLNSSDGKFNFSGYTVQMRNLRTGAITTDVVSSSGHFALASADLSRRSIIQAGDKLEITASDASGNVVSKVVRTVDADNIGRAYLNVLLRLGDIIPSQTALLQNYPNPFNPETWIPFTLAEDSLVRINIYDVNAHLVRCFELGRQGAGVYTSRERALYWDGRNETGERVSSGIYFYQLRAGDFTAVRKLVIAK
ncbi:MAG: DUF1326 domain-containing protein [Candidatus Poribacteria bacterium]